MKTTVMVLAMAAAALAGVTRERRPEIYLEYGSRDAAVSKVVFTVDGVDVTAKAKIGASRASYTPAEDLAIGEHKVEITVTDEKGRTRTKKWSFTVDPNAKDAEPPQVEFADPTPRNGDVRAPSKTFVAMRITDAIAGVESAKLWLAANGGSPREVALKRSGEWWTAELGELGSGVYLLRAQATDRDGNRAPDLWRGFAVDGEAPKVARVALAPDPVVLPGPATILVEVDDKPFGEVKEVRVEVAGRVLTGPAIRRLAAISWDLKDGSGKFVTAGKIAATVTVVDHGGLSATAKAEFVVRGEAPAEGEVPLRLDPVKPVTTTSPIAVSGGTKAGAEVELFVNGRPAGTKTAGGGGGFTFDRVDLDAGLNRITAVARDLAKGQSSAMVAVSTTYKTPGSGELAVGTGPTPVNPAPPENQAIGTPLAVDPPPAATEQGTTTVSGTTSPGAEVDVAVNGRPAGTARADGAGRVRIDNVALDAGVNRITVTARHGTARPATATVTTTRGGKEPPREQEPPHRP